MPLGGGIKLTAIPAPKIPGNTDPLGFGAAYVNNDWLLVAAGNYKDGISFVYQRSGTTWMQRQMLQSSKGTRMVPRGFGYGVVEGNHMIISAGREGMKAGAAYYFHYSGTKWVEKQILYASNSASNMHFGAPAALQGTTLVLGATGIVNTHYGQKPGAAYVFSRSGTKWTEQQIIAGIGAGGSRFGSGLALSGKTLLVGAYASNSTGAAYIYTKQGSTWQLQQKLTPTTLNQYSYFGAAGALEGDTAVVGAMGDNTKGTSAGAAYIFNRSGTQWTQTAKLVPSDLKKYFWFGGDVLLNGNVLLVGADEDDTKGKKAGSVYAYHRNGTTWSWQYKMYAPKGSGTQYFGSTLSLDNKTLAIGAGEVTYVGKWAFTPVDAGPPDLSADHGPDQTSADQGLDQTSADLKKSPDSGPPLDATTPDLKTAPGPDMAVADTATPDSSPAAGEQNAGCSCNVEEVPGGGAAPVALGLLLLYSRKKREM